MQSFKLFIIIGLACAYGFAQTDYKPDSLFKSGNQSMLQEDYTGAIKNYEKIVDQGHGHSDLFYNLGNAYFRKNQIGKAVWSYEKGLQLSPRDDDLLFNLALANARVRDRIEEPQAMWLLQQYRAFKKSVLLNDLILFAAVVLMLASFLYFLKKYYRWESIWILRLIIALFLISLLIHLIALDKYFELSDTREIVVIKPEVEIYSAPFAKRETILFRLHEGIKADVTQEQLDWLEIILLDGKKGWIQVENVLRL